MLFEKIQKYAKLIAALGGVVLTAVAQYALPVPDLALRIVQVLIALAAAVGVYAVPNRPEYATAASTDEVPDDPEQDA